MIDRLIIRLLYYLPPLLLALSFHESAHAYMAYRFGDTTARDGGRISLNPIAHIDPFGLIAILFFPIGWAKPVMINPYNLKNPIKDNIWISLAGPASNLILAVIFGLIFRLSYGLLSSSEAGQYFSQLIQISVLLNINLMVFNLIPIPPLDGFHILEGIVPTETYVKLQQIRQFGPLLLIAFVIFGGSILWAILGPIQQVLGGFLLGVPISMQ
jgi:Zn-dependent protease